MNTSDAGSCADGSVSRKRRSASSHSCGRWRVDTESLTEDILDDVGLSLMDDSSGLPTPPDSQNGATPALKPATAPGPAVDPYSVMDDGYVPEGFLVYKRRRTGSFRLHDPFCRQSDEIILKIFGFLSKSMLVRCARVCRRWRQLAFDETLWRRMDAAGRTIPAGGLGRLVQRGVRLLRLTRAEVSAPIFAADTSPGFSAKLMFLDLSMAVVPPEGIEQLLAACRSLQKLSLERCDVTDRACAAIGANRGLTALNLALATGLTDVGLGSILASCTRLSELNLGWTDLSGAALSKLAATAPLSLTKLNLTGCKDELTDAHVQQLLRRIGSRLRVLDLSDATAIGAGSFDAMMEHLPAVESLGLSRCYNIPAVNCVQLGRLQTLRTMEMYNCFNESGVETLRRALPQLQINTRPFSEVARPTVGIRRTSIWERSVRD
ncbi:S-phase kinase-associated protein 2-like [Amphibalanus amphitrite]|uniref:S-phase kinase-associated protein 2-like n=1 Tax=Amphibalanus amphitrite TaxID=1232801 RepID=UPI001C9019B2|nr:S-phase kinase-associated protein 2-like [Amphibalanus amphitrite]